MKTQNIFLSLLMAVGAAAIIYLILKNTIWKTPPQASALGPQAEAEGSLTVVQVTRTEAEGTGAEAVGTQTEVVGTQTEVQGTRIQGSQTGEAQVQITKIQRTEAEGEGTMPEAEGTMPEAEGPMPEAEEPVLELGIPLRGPNAMVITSSSSNVQGNNVDASIRLRSQNTITTVGTVDPETGYRVYTEPIVLDSLTSSPGGSVSFSLGDDTLLRKGLQLRVTCDNCN